MINRSGRGPEDKYAGDLMLDIYWIMIIPVFPSSASPSGITMISGWWRYIAGDVIIIS